jgi:hypothetical protein
MLALSKEPNRVGVSVPSPEDRNRSSFESSSEIFTITVAEIKFMAEKVKYIP